MRYYSKKSDASEAYFFAKCPKTDNDPAKADGRFLRQWEYAGDKGETLGWKVGSLEGLITGVEVKALGKDLFLNLTLGQDVIQFKLYSEDIMTLSQVLNSVNLNIPVKLVPYLKQDKAWKNQKSGKMVVPVGLSIKQNGEWLTNRWPYDKDARWFTGLPKPEVVKSALGIESKDFSKQHAAFDEAIAEFMDRCAHELGAEPDEPGTTVISAGSSVDEDADAPF